MADISIYVGTVYGNSLEVAEVIQEQLQQLGHTVTLEEPGTIESIKSAANIIFCTSTTGAGDLPDDMEVLYYDLKNQFPILSKQTFSVVGLGDSSYGDTFCGGGRKVHALLNELQGIQVLDLFILDASESFEPEKDILKWIPEYHAELATIQQ